MTTATNSATKVNKSDLVSAISNPGAMATVLTIAKKLVKVASKVQLKTATGSLVFVAKDGKVFSATDTKGEYLDSEDNKVKVDPKTLANHFPTQFEVFAILSDLGMLRPILENHFSVMERDSKGKYLPKSKQVDWVSFNTDLHSCRVDWFRNAFRKLAGLHRENEGPKPWNEVFSGSKGKSKGRKVATTGTGMVVTFDLDMDSEDDNDS